MQEVDRWLFFCDFSLISGERPYLSSASASNVLRQLSFDSFRQNLSAFSVFRAEINRSTYLRIRTRRCGGGKSETKQNERRSNDRTDTRCDIDHHHHHRRHLLPSCRNCRKYRLSKHEKNSHIHLLTEKLEEVVCLVR